MGIEGHIDRLYDERLRRVREHILAMGRDVHDEVAEAVQSLLHDQPGSRATGSSRHAAISQSETDIDGECLVTLATRAPVASDLRFVMTAMKVATELGRVGDLAKAIRERSPALTPALHELDRSEILAMATIVQSMLDQLLVAFANSDMQAAAHVVGRELEVNEAYARAFDRTLAAMAENTESVHEGVSVQGVVKRLERMADHVSRAAQSVLARSRSLT